jgi:hypothetical protein
MARKTLEDLFAEDDDSGLLDVAPRPVASTDQTRIQQGFEEINQFIDRHKFSPGKGPRDRKITPSERTLQARLDTYRQNPDIIALLSPHDHHGLLRELDSLAPATLDELLDLDDDLLNDPNESLFSFKHARAPSARPEKVASRMACKDFETFLPLFDEVANDLANGLRRTKKFANEMEIEPGGFFILHGVTVYIAEVKDFHVRNGKRNARLRVIFENGTEGHNLLRSLARELYKDPNGRRISDPNPGPLFDPTPTVMAVPAEQNRITGVVYVVRSLSPLAEIIKHDGQLFKIGFTTGTLEDRIRNAKDDPTFLLAPVLPVRSYEAINLNTNKFENLIHRFFEQARLDIELKDRFGKPFRPREWFLLPLPIIEEGISRLLDGSIIKHRYDHHACKIVRT